MLQWISCSAIREKMVIAPFTVVMVLLSTLGMKFAVNGNFSSSLIEAVQLIIAENWVRFESQVYLLRLEPDGNYLNLESPEFKNSATLLFLASQFIIGKEKRKYLSFLPTWLWIMHFFFITNSALLDIFLEKWWFVLKNKLTWRKEIYLRNIFL